MLLIKKRVPRMLRPGLSFGIALVAAGCLMGCAEFHYYDQALRGHLDVMEKSRPLKEVLQQLENSKENGTHEEYQALEKIPEILRFAEDEMGLPSGRSYKTYADLGRPYVVWNVFAAEEFDLQPIKWWYPLLGRLAYRGYFSEEEAQAYAEKLKQRGLDVMVAGVDAYSTLGWFGDPLLNTFIDLKQPALVAFLCHELAHRKLFFPGNTAISEAFATVVEEQALERWIALKEIKGGELQNYKRKQQVINQVHAEWEMARRHLEDLYASGRFSDAAGIRVKKRRIFKTLEERCIALVRPISRQAARRLSDLPFNNARLAMLGTYHGMVPPLRRILMEECGGDLHLFYREMKKIKQGKRPFPESSYPRAAHFPTSTLKKSRRTFR